MKEQAELWFKIWKIQSFMPGDLLPQLKSQVGIKLLFLLCGESLLKFIIILEDNKCMDNKKIWYLIKMAKGTFPILKLSYDGHN